MGTNAARLHAAIAAVADIVGVSIGDPGNKATWRIDFADGTSFRYGDGPKDARQNNVATTITAYDPTKLERRTVPKSVIISRLSDPQLDAALAAMTNRQKERWRSSDHPTCVVDDPEMLALLKAVGADPALILAP